MAQVELNERCGLDGQPCLVLAFAASRRAITDSEGAKALALWTSVVSVVRTQWSRVHALARCPPHAPAPRAAEPTRVRPDCDKSC